MRYLSLCAIVKDEEESYLHEWLNYHRALGVEHVYIYDNESLKPLTSVLSRQISQGWVDVFRMPGRGVQMIAYAHCLKYFGSSNQWIGFLDLDEFLVPSNPQDLRPFLAAYEPYGALGVNWLCFGSSGWMEKPGPSQIAHFIHRTPSSSPDNRHIKSIVQPRFTTIPVSPHHFLYKEGKFCVNEQHERIDGPFMDNSVDTIRVNHYFLRSKAQYMKKIERGRATGLSKRSPDLYDYFENPATIPDQAILAIWDPENQKPRSNLTGSMPYQAQGAESEQRGPFIPPDTVHPNVFDMDFILSKAMDSIQEGSFQVALGILAVFLDRYPQNPDGYMLLSELFIRTGNMHNALRCLDHAEKKGLPGSIFFCQRGIIHNRMNQFAEAQSWFDQAHQINPSDVVILIQLARNALDMNRASDALEILKKASLIEPDNSEIQQGLKIVSARILNERSFHE